MAGKGEGRLVAIDVARVCLALLVAGGHTVLYHGLPDTLGAALVNGMARITVPFFLIVSGAFFPRGPERFRGWVAHVLRLYLFWTLVYLPFLVTLGAFSWPKLGFYLVTGYAHLWYLPALIGGGLMLWLVRDWPAGRVMALALGLFAAGWGVQLAENLLLDFADLRHRNAWLALPRNFLFFGFPCLALGHLIARGAIGAGMGPARLVAVLVAGLGAMGVEAMLNHDLFGPEGIFDLYLGVLLVGPALFLLMARVPVRANLPWLAPMSAAIYFVHPIFVFLLAEWAGLPLPVEVGAVLVLSVIAARGLVLLSRRVPVV